jgi:MFS family permease
MGKHFLTRVVLVLSFVSLFNDISSEMLYPVMPLFLQQAGFTVISIGFIEGLAQFIIGLSTGYFGKLSDSIGRRMPFVISGYMLSTLAKPLMVMISSIPWIFSMRLTERLGKGIRTAARDALLTDEAERQHTGKVFGFHRALDTTGAVIGPVVALWYLNNHPGDYKNIFLYAFFPAFFGILLMFLVKEKSKVREPVTRIGFFSYLKYWKSASVEYRKIVTGLMIFALVNSSDIFLFLLAKNAGIGDEQILLSYIVYNIVFAVVAFPAGWLADKWGMKWMMMAGLLFFAITYFGFAINVTGNNILILFIIYGLYAAFSEGISKAWISLHCEKNDAGTAQGFLRSTTSILALFSSLLTGLIWTVFSPTAAFLFASSGALLAIIFWLFTLPLKVSS